MRPTYSCPYCGSTEPPAELRTVSVGGWVFMGVGVAVAVFLIALGLVFLLACVGLPILILGVFLLPVAFLGLLMREESRACYDCGMRLR